MEVVSTSIPEVKIIKPRVFGDDRGFFMETWHYQKFEAFGIPCQFVQDNHSRSVQGTLRGLHYQIQQPQGKLVRVVKGCVFDVAVDMRKNSPTFGQWVGVELSEENRLALWVPEGFAHGFYVMSAFADFSYKCTDYYAPQFERSLLWNDSTVGVEWPIPAGESPILSPKDAAAASFLTAEVFL
jgi:dTDP-4-dehydrorhamnose 3,5-epimerase